MGNILSASELAQIKKDINEIVTDTSINVLLKYRQYTGNIYYDTQDQVYPSPFTDYSGVSAVKGLITQRELRTVAGAQIGDTKFVFMQTSVPNALSVSDLIVESDTTFQVKSVSSDPLGLVYLVYTTGA